MERKSSSKAITRIYNMTGKSTQIKKGLKRALTLLLAFLFMLSTVAMAVPDANGYIDDGASQSVASHEQIISVPAHGGDGFISDDNGSIKFYVNQSTGGFYILPSSAELDESKPPSFGSFRIDGEEFVFGGNYPGAFFVMPPMINHGGTAQAVWYKNGLYISQYLNIVQNEVRANSYAVYIRYEIESAYYGETFNGNVEGRILIDTMFGAYDNLPVKISGGEALTYETVFDESNMPAYFGNDTSSGVYPRVYGLLIDSSVTKPSSLTFADLDNVSGTVFDYNPNTSQVITDSAVLLYFEGQRDGDGSVFFSTIYGFDVEAVGLGDNIGVEAELPYKEEIFAEYARCSDIASIVQLQETFTLSSHGVRSIAAGWSHTVAIKNDGSLWAWGNNSNAQLGLGYVGNQRNEPIRIGSATNWVSVTASANHTLATRADGTLWAWGYNRNGRLGLQGSPAYTDFLSVILPARVGVASNWASVSAGYSHSLATRTDGSLWAWGWGAEGQLGEHPGNSPGTFPVAWSPIRVGTASNWASVSAGYSHSLATRTDGTLWAWGNNASGQLGDGTTTARMQPIRIGTASNWASVSAGHSRSLGIRADGSLWAWGSNASGQLEPIRIGTASNWASVSAGFGIRADGSLWAWGSNASGQLGRYALTQPAIGQACRMWGGTQLL